VSADRAAALRSLPSVDQLVRRLAVEPVLAGLSRARLTAAVRETLDAERRRVAQDAQAPADADTLAARAVALARQAGRFSLRPVINATGVVLHTNLGRALLSDLARERVAAVAGAYSNLELDLASKERGSRYSHVETLLRRLTGAEDALVVNNNAAAVLLALETLAHGKEVVVSRGELIEIGGEFRIPDIMLRSGAILREVGATNRTHLRDYAEAIGPNTALLLKVHTSNYRVIGFTADVSGRQLTELGREHGIPVMEDLGSGSLIDLRPWGFPYEPTVQEVVGAGVDLVSFSGDKLLGGPQAGIVVGKRAIVSRLKKNPWNRALRIDKFTIAALEATLVSHQKDVSTDEVPVIQMLALSKDEIEQRARNLIEAAGPAEATFEVLDGESTIGGGAGATSTLPTKLVAISHPEMSAQEIEHELRTATTPVISRIAEGKVLLDLRTVFPDELPSVVDALTELFSHQSASEKP